MTRLVSYQAGNFRLRTIEDTKLIVDKIITIWDDVDFARMLARNLGVWYALTEDDKI
jgi:hypothetical protein